MQTEPKKKASLRTFQLMKSRGEPVSFITAYDFPFAQRAEAAGVDMILVGDSGGMTMLGYETTTPVTMDEMMVLAKAARRGAPKTFMIGDMPLGSYQTSEADAVHNALRFLKEAGSDAVKVEGGVRIGGKIKAMVDAGILVMGHLGLTPQNTAQFGGYRVQGKTAESLTEIINDAQYLEKVGVFAILLEAMPEAAAEAVCKAVSIPVYGIGAGAKLDGQLLIMHDVVGLFSAFQPKFAKRYCEAGQMITKAIQEYAAEVKNKSFPSSDFVYPISTDELTDIKPVIAKYAAKKGKAGKK
jgi:3-methyl-2-oxobutanoate hydroxymethyltransferase